MITKSKLIPLTSLETFPWMEIFWAWWESVQLIFCIALYQLKINLPFFQTLFLKNRKLNRRQYEILIYNDCLYRNMYRLDFLLLSDVDKLSHRVSTGSSTSPSWTSTRWSCPRSTAAGRQWWRRCWRLRQRTQTPSAGISATSTSSTGWLRIASRICQKSGMGTSLILFLIIPSLNTCTWWTTCSGVQTIQKVNVDIDW